MKTAKSIIAALIIVMLFSCGSNHLKLKKKLTGKWKGYAELNYDKSKLSPSSVFPFSDSLLAYYQSMKKDYITISLFDSFAVVDGLNLYRNRVFQIDWNPLIAGKNYLSLWCETTREDLDLRNLLINSVRPNVSEKDSLSSTTFIMELFDITKDREVIFLKDIKVKGDSMWCNVETDMVIEAKQKLLMKKNID